ncbi:MAG TPA: VWA domain-containing protein [Acidobacteriota bacterium]|nr:VWA domain-containing protein [Acidobacteriota bacterium]
MRSSSAGSKPLILLTAVWFLVSFQDQAPARHAQQIPAIRVESALVNVPVIVSDDKGRYIPGLRGGDFELFQDEVPQTIALFAASEEPIRIGLLLDTSKSTITVLNRIKKAAEAFILQLRPQDQAFVASFDSDIRYLSPFSSDRRELGAAVRSARIAEYTGTKMRDAILEVMQRKFRPAQGRKAIILLTDGQDYGSSVSPPDLLRAVAASNTVIYSIHYNVDPRAVMKKLFGVHSRLPAYKSGGRRGPYAVWSEREDEAAAYLDELSELSAGRFFRSDVTDLTHAFAQVAEELRHQYLLGFYPDQSKLDGKSHSLRVEVSLPDARVRARRSYQASN